MNRQFPGAQFSKAARRLGVAAVCLALSAPLSAQEPKPRAIFEGHVGGVESLSFSPDGKTLASACSGCSIKLWDVASGRNTATMKEEGPGAKKLPYRWATAAFSPDGKKLATGGWFNRVKLWDVATLKGQVLLDDYKQCPETWIVFSHDGETLASGGVCRGEMKLFDVASGQARSTYLKTPGTFGDYNPHGVLAAAFTPDGKTLVSIAIPNEIRLWDVATGKQSKLQKTDQEIGQWCNAIAAFSPDVKTVATSQYGDTSITLWEVATSKARAVFKGQKEQEVKVWSLTFSLDGKTLASGDEKGTIKLWDVAGGKELASYTGHAGKVLCLAISADGKMLASGGQDRTIKLWDTAKSR
jgi:WD40 repeat protein